MIQPLLLNLAIILAAAYLISVFGQKVREGGLGPYGRDLRIAPFFAITTVLLLSFPAFTPMGATMDARAAPLVLAGVFGGPVSTALSVLAGSLARAAVGGPYVLGGVISMACYGALGLAMRGLVTSERTLTHQWALLFITSIASVLVVLPTFFVDVEFAQSVQNLRTILPYLIVQNTVGIMIFGIAILRIEKAAEAANEAATLRAALSRATNGVMILEGREAPVITYANDGAAAILGRPTEMVTGRRWAEIVVPAPSDTGASTLIDAMKRGAAHVTELWLTTPNAGLVLLKGTLTPVVERERERLRFILILDDVTREREQASLLQVVTEHIPLLVAYFDSDMLCRYTNGAYNRFFGLQPKDVLGRHLQDIVGAENFATIRSSVQAVLAGQRSERQIELDFPNAGGRCIVRESLLPQFDPDRGVVVGYVVMVEDITNQVRTEETLRRSEKLSAVGTLTGSLAHDFNNLNAVIIGNLELAQTEPRADRQQRHLRAALDASERAAALTHKLLSFSRKASLRPETVDVASELQAHAKLLEASMSGRAQLEVSIASDLPKITVDRDGLLSALMNLVINARDATLDGGVVRLRARSLHVGSATDLKDGAWSGDLDASPVGDYVCIEVIDEGEGVRPEHRQRILDPFFTTKPFGISAGLGLSSTYGFVRQSQGLLRIGDHAPRGTHVTMLFPVTSTSHEGKTPVVQDAAQFDGHNRLVILVEDEPELLSILTQHLQSFDLRVAAFGTADEASRAIDDGLRPDFLVTDLMVRGDMHGAALAGKVLEQVPSAAVVIVTGYPTDQLTELPLDDSRLRILQKPVSRADLRRALAKADKVRPVLAENDLRP